MNEKKKKIDNTKKEIIINKADVKQNKKGRYAEKLKLPMDFNEALNRAINTKIKIDKKNDK